MRKPRIPIAGVVLLCFLSQGCSGDADPWAEATGLVDWEQLPVLDTSRYEQQSSYDRCKRLDYPVVDPGNKDFNNFLAVCGDRPGISLQETDEVAGCEQGMRGYLIAKDDEGPGMVTRIWMTTADLITWEHYGDEIIKIYVDDMSRPSYQGRLSAWVTGDDPAFRPPLAGWWSGGLVSYLPILYDAKLRILIDNLETGKLYYHHVDLRRVEAGGGFPATGVDHELAASMSGIVSGGVPVPDGTPLVDGLFNLPAGEDTEIFDHQGRGTVRHLRFAFDEADPALLDAVILRFFWDGMSTPAIETSLAEFFGCRQALRSYRTLPMRLTVEGPGADLQCFLPMPFDERARAELHNANPFAVEVVVTVALSPNLPGGEWGYLHTASSSTSAPYSEGDRYLLLNQTGRGKYVGTMMFLAGKADPDNVAPSSFNFLEGDEKGVIDGELRIPGTGTEDYFNGAWYFAEGPHAEAFSALIHIDEDGALQTGEASMVRWHILADGINFQDSLLLDMEYGADKPSTALDYASVAFVYLGSR